MRYNFCCRFHVHTIANCQWLKPAIKSLPKRPELPVALVSVNFPHNYCLFCAAIEIDKKGGLTFSRKFQLREAAYRITAIYHHRDCNLLNRIRDLVKRKMNDCVLVTGVELHTATGGTEIVVKDKIGIACHFSLSIQHKQASLRGTVKSRTGGIIKPESQCSCVKRNVLS